MIRSYLRRLSDASQSETWGGWELLPWLMLILVVTLPIFIAAWRP